MSQSLARTTTRRYGPGSAGLTMTPAEFDAIPADRFDDRCRYELIRGVLVVTPPPDIAGRDPNDELGHLLRQYRDTHPESRALDLTVFEQTIATPTGRRPDPAVDVPAIVVEFVSARRRDATRDYELKRDEYLAAGVKEYWVVDRFRRTLTVFRPAPAQAGLAHEVLVVADGQTYRTDLLPGFSLPLAALLARADAWPRARPRKPPAPGA